VRPHGELDRQREQEHGDERSSLFERRRYLGSGGLGHGAGAGFTRREDRPGDGVHAPVAPAQARVIPGRADVRHTYVDSGQRPPQLDVTPRIVDRVAAQVLGEFAARTRFFVLGDEPVCDGCGKYGRVPRVRQIDRNGFEQFGKLAKPADVAG
jgi:hypothetical protein